MISISNVLNSTSKAVNKMGGFMIKKLFNINKMSKNKFLKKSISQLEGWTWNMEIPIEDNSSYEEFNFYLLHNKALIDYSLEDIYFMIGQETGLVYLVPMALNELEKNPLLMATDYEGDLLNTILNIKKPFWKKNLKLYSRFYDILLSNKNKIDEHDDKDLILSREVFLKVLIK